MTTITISGTPGSGKSTVADLLNKQLNLSYVYSGQLFRNLAESYGMSLEEFGRYCESNDDIDRKIDEQQIEILKAGDVLLEGRLSGWLAHQNGIDAVKIMIDADETVRVERIVNREGGLVFDRLAEMKKRETSERKRYQIYYGIDLFDTSIYDLVIDSSEKTPDEIVGIIIGFLEKKDL